jgi:hypothetical protein
MTNAASTSDDSLERPSLLEGLLSILILMVAFAALVVSVLYLVLNIEGSRYYGYGPIHISCLSLVLTLLTAVGFVRTIVRLRGWFIELKEYLDAVHPAGNTTT